MKTLLALDPGVTSGLACFYDTRLVDVRLLQTAYALPLVILNFPLFDEGRAVINKIVVELPQIYPVGKWKGDPNDLIEVAFAGGRWTQYLINQFFIADVQTIKPSTWKGQRPKKIDNEYTLSLLTVDERALVDALKAPPSKIHNAIDAIGIGLWAVGRR